MHDSPTAEMVLANGNIAFIDARADSWPLRDCPQECGCGTVVLVVPAEYGPGVLVLDAQPRIVWRVHNIRGDSVPYPGEKRWVSKERMYVEHGPCIARAAGGPS